MDEMLELPATQLAAHIRDKTLSPVELLEASIERIEALNPIVNAVITTDFKQARAQAKKAEKAVLQKEPLGLLHGLPVGIKDLENTKGLTTTFGSKLFANNIPKEDQLSVAGIRREGGIIIGKTNTPEFGTGGNTRNLLFGATGNPFAPQKTSGGSSGGAAVGLATGMMTLASGSDYGGSLRTPASFCGVVGFRPTAGIVPAENRPVSLSPFSVIGPMGRTVSDAQLLLSAQLGRDRYDPFSGRPDFDLELPGCAADLSRLSVMFSADLDGAPLCQAYRRLFSERLKPLRGQFAHAFDGDPDFKDADQTFEVLRGVNFIAAHAAKIAQHENELSPFVVDNVKRGQGFSAADVAWAHIQQTRIAKNWIDLFDDIDAIIAPASSVPPFDHQSWSVSEIDGTEMNSYMHWLALCYRPTTALACSVALPCGTDENGLPFGIQIMGPPGSDRKILDIALAIEQFLSQDPVTKRPVISVQTLLKAKR